MRQRKFKALVFTLLAAAVCFSGCGEAVEEPEMAETGGGDTVAEIPVAAGLGDVLDLTGVPKEEWPDITWEQVRDFTMAFLPSYREVYGISDGHEMEEEDWEQMKGLMFYQLFGQVYGQYLDVGDVYHDVKTVEEEYGADWIYFAPTKEYLESLGPDEIAAYFQELYPKVFGITPKDGEGSVLQFRDFSDGQLLEAMRIFIEEQFGK